MAVSRSQCDIYLMTNTKIHLILFQCRILHNKTLFSNIKSIGTASRGGSSAYHESVLFSGRLTLRYGRMMSWKPNGKTFDGNGTKPDIFLLPDPQECEYPPKSGIQMKTACA